MQWFYIKTITIIANTSQALFCDCLLGFSGPGTHQACLAPPDMICYFIWQIQKVP